MIGRGDGSAAASRSESTSGSTTVFFWLRIASSTEGWRFGPTKNCSTGWVAKWQKTRGLRRYHAAAVMGARTTRTAGSGDSERIDEGTLCRQSTPVPGTAG